MATATATAHPNIALVKYWGKRDRHLNLPTVSSLSLTLDRFQTRTRVVWGAERDTLIWNGGEPTDKVAERVFLFLDRVDAHRPPCLVDTHNNFPAAAGLASSSSGFAALALAASAASGQSTDPERVSVLSRMGSGSACRSLWGGFVEWRRGERADGTDSHGVPVAPIDHWDVAMVVAIASEAEKSVGSTEGMLRTAKTSAYYDAWVHTAEDDVTEGRAAVLARDLERLGTVMEQSTFKMHATMHTAWPPIIYWQPQTLAAVHEVHALRKRGIGAWATMDAGPNVKVLCLAHDAQAVADALRPTVPRVEIHHPGAAPTLVVG